MAANLASEALLGQARAATGGLPNVPPPPLTDADYWAFADWIQPVFDAAWNEQKVSYNPDPRANAGLLLTHSIAAYTGHQGATRNDARAAQLAVRLCQAPPYRPLGPGQSRGSDSPRSKTQAHRPGFVANMSDPNAYQHISIDPKICEGLYFAWVARQQLGLPQSTVTLLEQTISKVANSRFNLYPNIRLNQINWGAELYEYEYLVNNNPRLLRNDYREQVVRFANGMRKPTEPWKITNTSQSWSFHRDPFQSLTTPQNVESNEYALIMLDFIKRYDTAIQAGMRPVTGKTYDAVRAFTTRALGAYWTHGGYLNWDTGLYLQRWHLGRYWAWAVQGLLAIQQNKAFTTADERAWAKYIFDRSIALYVQMVAQNDPTKVIPPETTFNVPTTFGLSPFDFSVRFQWHAARAVFLGLGSAPTEQPPPLYAYDPPIGRLAITTPSYNTAIVGCNNRAFPYGGIDICRLYDSNQNVAACVGGRAPAGFGVIVANGAGGTVVKTQSPRPKPDPDNPPYRLTKSPRGPIKTGVAYPKSPYAGPFKEIQASGIVRGGGAQIRSTTTFRSESIDFDWALSRNRGSKMSATGHFPTWGKNSGITAVLKNGQQVTVSGSQEISLADVDYLYMRSQYSGYALVFTSFSEGAKGVAINPAAQSDNPTPGPSLAVVLAEKSDWRSLKLQARIAPATTPAQAAQIAAALRG